MNSAITIGVIKKQTSAASTTLPDIFLGTTSRQLSFDALLDNFNLTVKEGAIPVLFFTDGRNVTSNDLPQVSTSRYLWKLGSGEFFPIGSENVSSKLELIDEKYLSNDHLEIILSGENAEEVSLGEISEDFISYMNNNGTYALTNISKTYIVTFTKDDIDYAYIFQGTLGTYGSGNLQFVQDDFIFIYQSTNAGEPTNSTYIRITRAKAVALQATASFVPNTTYVITDADINLYGGTEITLTAITENQLSLQGSGLFYCPKYDLSVNKYVYNIWKTYMEGAFSNVVGTFTRGNEVTAQNGAKAIYLAEGFLNYISGDWSAATSIEETGTGITADVSDFVSPSYMVGQIVHWGGKSWTNVNGNVGTSIDKYTLDEEWQEIPFNATDYNVYVDEIQYDFGNDMIIYRKDRYNNIVSGSNQVFVEFQDPNGYGHGNPIKDFQWGCAQDDFNTDDFLYIGIQGNQVIDSYFETLNSLAEYIWFNELSKQSYIKNNALSSNSYILNNILSSNSYIDNNALNNSYIKNNTLSSSSYILNNTLGSSTIQDNTLSGSNFSSNILSGSSNIYYNTLSSGSISDNTLSGSNIYNNTLSSNSYIQNNNLSGYSYIENNTLSGSGYISDNTLISGYIQYNTLNISNIYKNILRDGFSRIQNNTLNISTISNNTLSGSNISNSTLNNSSMLQFTGGDVVSKTLSRLTMEGNDTEIPITATIIFNPDISKTIFKREDGTSRVQYVNDIDVIVITDVNA